MKMLKKICKLFLQFIFLLIIIANLFIVLSGRFYLYKGIYHTYLQGKTGPTIYDKDIFENSTLKKSTLNEKWKVSQKKYTLNSKIEKTFNNLETSSFIVVKNDVIIYEKYWNGHTKETVSNSFSASKTIVALLIGIALQEGKIKSLDEPVGNYLNSFKLGDKQAITIRHLLMMSSGLDWEESGKNPLSENAESYYGTDLWGLVNRQKKISKPGVNLNYQSGNSQLLGYIIEKATKQDLTEYARSRIWSKIGAESDAFWSLDKKNGDEKSFCCLYGTSRDFARIGKLILNKGKWNNQQIIEETYMQEMFKNPKLITEENIPNYRYGLHIWTYLVGNQSVYYCRGILGQYIISIPSENIVIVRTGMKRMKNIEKSSNKYKIGHPADLFMYISTAKKIANSKN